MQSWDQIPNEKVQESQICRIDPVFLPCRLSVLIVTGREAGASTPQLASIAAIDASSVSRRFDAAKLSLTTNSKLAYAKLLVEQEYRERIAESNV